MFHDVVNMRHARNAISAGVDGLVLVCAGAGGHGGQANPFAFIEEARREFDGAIGLAGGITTGRGVAAAVAAGADFAYVGTHFITTTESMAPDRHKEMMIGAEMADIIHTDAISGVPGNFLRQSLGRRRDRSRQADLEGEDRLRGRAQARQQGLEGHLGGGAGRRRRPDRDLGRRGDCPNALRVSPDSGSDVRAGTPDSSPATRLRPPA